MSQQSVWSPARALDLCEQYGGGATFATIAKGMGLTSNTVIGKWNRLLREIRDWSENDTDVLCEMMAGDEGFEAAARFFDSSIEVVVARFALVRRALGAQAN